MNTVQPHNIQQVDTTVGELEPGTLFRSGPVGPWLMRNQRGNRAVATYLLDMTPWFELDTGSVVEIADSVTIGKVVSDERT